MFSNLVAEGLALIGLPLDEAKKKKPAKKPAKKAAGRHSAGTKKVAAKRKAAKASGKKPHAKSAKQSALVKKLSKQPGVRDAEALAAWIGHRMGGSKSHGKKHKKTDKK